MVKRIIINNNGIKTFMVIKWYYLFYYNTSINIFHLLLLVSLIIYDISYLLLLQNECILLMLKWLLICHGLLLVMKILLNYIYIMGGETNSSEKTNKILALSFYFFLYPLLIIWNILGTIWFFKIQDEPVSECVILF